MDVCVHGGLHCRRKAGASKWAKSGPSGPSSSSCLLFRGPKNGAKNRPQKRGRNIAGRRQGFQNGGPVSGTRVLHTPSAPLCVQWVAQTPEPFVCFPGNGLDKASSKFHIQGPPSRMHFSYADAAPKAGPGGSAVWEQADWQPNAFSTTELWGNQVQRIMFGKACGSKTGKGCRTPCGQTPRRPHYPKILLLKPTCK